LSEGLERREEKDLGRATLDRDQCSPEERTGDSAFRNMKVKDEVEGSTRATHRVGRGEVPLRL